MTRATDNDYKSTTLWASAVITTMFRGYLLMIGLGILHLGWTTSIPALGLWECVILSAAFTLVKR